MFIVHYVVFQRDASHEYHQSEAGFATRNLPDTRYPIPGVIGYPTTYPTSPVPGGRYPNTYPSTHS
eukprot:scaffold18520_cov62-Cyclotella_meneghiniana.AAC.1